MTSEYRGFREVAPDEWSNTIAFVHLQWGEWKVYLSNGAHLLDGRPFATPQAAIDAYHGILAL